MKYDPLLLLLIVFTGCSQSTSLTGLVPCGGTVTLNGAPLDGANLTFVPVQADARAAGALTDASGAFVVGTLQAKDGIAPGKYTVAVSKKESKETPSKRPALKKTDGKPGPKLPLPSRSDVVFTEKLGKYGDAKTSDLTVEIPAQGNKNLKLELSL